MPPPPPPPPPSGSYTMPNPDSDPPPPPCSNVPHMAACGAIHFWTVCSLMAAFLDLALAYLLLCCAAAALLAGKLLDLFGLSPPCSCSGALQELLVDFPAAKISAVKAAARSRFPFEFVFAAGEGQPAAGSSRSYEIRRVDDEGEEDGDHDRRGEEESRGSISISPGSMAAAGDLSGLPTVVFRSEINSGDDDGKRKAAAIVGLSSPRPKALRRRRRGRNPAAVSEGKGSAGLVFAPIGNHSDLVLESAGVSIKDLNLCESKGEELGIGMSSEMELGGGGGGQAAYAELYLELEKERSAAKSAADEAMAMISRLQEEKSAMGMENRQYQRMVEEKSAYDEEEMDILKAIIVRREMENHALESELEGYRKMLPGGGDITSAFAEFPGSGRNSIHELMRHRPCSSTKDFRDLYGYMESNTVKNEVVVMEDSNVSDNFGFLKRHAKDSDSYGECSQQFQEKGMLAMDNQPSSVSNVEKDPEKSRTIDPSSSFEAMHEGSSSESIYDVHVVDDKTILGEECDSREGDLPQARSESVNTHGSASRTMETSELNHFYYCSIDGCGGLRDRIRRSPSPSVSLSMNPWSERGSYTELRRNSMSAVDNERVNLETEVELLMMRLRMAQQGRENSTLSVEHREEEVAFQLKLLEELASQLREIRKITDLKKGLRQTSLPPQSSKVDSRKRRCNSVNWGAHESM